MPLFELASAQSGELVAAHQLAERLSETDAIHDLAETTDDATALAQIVVGISADPVAGDEYTLTELDEQHFYAQVYAEPEEGHVAAIGPEVLGSPREGGVLCVYLRRRVRGAEERRDTYNFFWDRVSALGKQVIPAAEALATLTNRNRFTQVGRVIGPEFGKRRAEGDQGDVLFALLKFTWGDVQSE